MKNYYSYLALGDSYTVGESLALFDSYPYQAVQVLRKFGKMFHAPEIVAKTGWTTSELFSKINESVLNPVYDFVSILIGVNNQYRGLPSSQYTLEFEELLMKALSLSDNNRNHIFVLSIPDWSLTPYARGRDTGNISRDIALFNSINRTISKNHRVNYIDVTTASPETAHDLTYLSVDGLHPSAKAYGRWAKLLSEKMMNEINEPVER